MKLFNVFLVTNQSETKFNADRKRLTALSHVSRFLYWSGTESNKREQVLIALIHIYWVA